MSETSQVQELNGSLEGFSDFELQNRRRTRPVTFKITLPPGCSVDQPANGVAFYIPGFGDDNNADYVTKLRRTISENHNLACVTVDYHCIQARIDQGAGLKIDSKSEEKLALYCALYNVPFNRENIMPALVALDAQIPGPTELRMTILPPDDEYQNFGVLQALDHLCVLNDLIDADLPIDWNNVILIGSSHGGYIAHLMAKFAPNSINAIIDNSSYTRAPLNYLGLYPEAGMSTEKFLLAGSVQSPWQFADRSKPGYYGLPPQLIRETAFPPHLAEMQKQSERLPRYFCFNSIEDAVSPIHEKRLQTHYLKAIGCEVALKEVTAADIDGQVFKTLDHGLDASMKRLCQMILPQIQPRPTTLDRDRCTHLAYDCYDAVYHITHQPKAPWLQLQIISPVS